MGEAATLELLEALSVGEAPVSVGEEGAPDSVLGAVAPPVSVGLALGKDSVGAADLVSVGAAAAVVVVASPPTGGMEIGTPAAEHWDSTMLETAGGAS